MSIQDIKNNLKNPKFEGFTVRNGNNLFYSPTNQQVIESNEVQAKTNSIYTQFGIGSGIKTLYEQVSRRFLGITRKQVQEFLQSQSNYQIGKSKLKQTNKKIYSSDIMKSWYLDLIDCNPIKTGNKGYRYIMTIVDGFSRYVFLTKLKNKDCISVVEGIESISNLYANNQYPKTLVSDNGFRDQYVADFCRT